ncbi:MAG TPA: hypothetical protein VF784_01040 [Anaerolineales bacterium]
MKYRKKPPLTAREIQMLILIGLVAGAVLGTLVGADIRLSRALPGGGGFFAAWDGARAFLLHHASPYGTDVASAAQQAAYGRPARVGENPYRLAMPFFLLPVYFPLAFASDPSTARGIWVFVNEAALVGMAFLSLRITDWQPSRMFQIGYALLSVFGFYSVVALLEGGPAILLGLLYPSILFAYQTGQDELAGALLVFTLFAWEIGLLFVLFVLWKAIYDKRWRVFAGLFMMLAVLLIVSFMIYPGWAFPFLAAALAAFRSPFGTSSGAILLRLFPAQGVQAAQALTVLLVILLFYEWAATRRADPRRFIWAGCLTLAVTPLLGLRIEITNLVALLPGLALIFAAIVSRWRSGYWLASLLLLITLLLPWGWFVRWYWLHDQRSNDYLILFLPVFTTVGLYWTRWWFVRPPRTWFEHVRSTLPAARQVTTRRRPISPG